MDQYSFQPPTYGISASTSRTEQYGEFQTGIAHSYTDNRDGTITDHGTGLMWEKPADDDRIHDWDTDYLW